MRLINAIKMLMKEHGWFCAGLFLMAVGISFSKHMPVHSSSAVIFFGFAVSIFPCIAESSKVEQSRTDSNNSQLPSLKFAVQKLYKEKQMLSDQVDELSAVREVSLAVGAILDFSEMIRAILDLVTTNYGISKALIYLQSDDEMWYEIVGAKANGKDISPARVLQKRIKIGEGLVGKSALERRKIFEIRDGKGTVAALPLLAKNRVVGVLKLFDPDSNVLNAEKCRKLHAVAGAIGIALENSRLYRMAVTDHLTGLYVRRHFELRLEEEFKRSMRYRTALSLLMVDIDYFKKVNDTYGHPTGDVVLKNVSAIIIEESRGTDIPCRYGGEEITVICPEADLSGAFRMASRIRERIESYNFKYGDLPDEILKVTVSIGISTVKSEMKTRKELIEETDKALYEAKRSGRNQVIVSESAKCNSAVVA